MMRLSLDTSKSSSLTTIEEDIGDVGLGNADLGTTIANIVHNDAITDVDGASVKAIAVTWVENTDGVWQYSLNSGVNWTNVGPVSSTSGIIIRADQPIKVQA